MAGTKRGRGGVMLGVNTCGLQKPCAKLFRVIGLLLLILLLFAFSSSIPSVGAEQTAVFTVGSTIYTVNGQQLVMDVAPFIRNSRTYVPVRFLANALGAPNSNINWFPATGEVMIYAPPGTANCDYIQLWINGNDLSLFRTNPYQENNEQMDVTPIIVNGRVMLPARWVAQAFGDSVAWNQSTQQVIIPIPYGQTATTLTTTSTNNSSTPLAFPQGTLPVCMPGQSYNDTLNASGGIPPYTYQVTQGALPPGLSLSSNGTVSGTPTDTPGTYDFTVVVTDSAGATASGAFSIANIGTVTITVQPTQGESDASWVNQLLPGNVHSGIAARITPWGQESISLTFSLLRLLTGRPYTVTLTLAGHQILKYADGKTVDNVIVSLAEIPPGEIVNGRPPITGRVVNNELPVTLEVTGPNGTQQIKGVLDTGSVVSSFPDSFLRNTGFSPEGSQTVEGVTGEKVENEYQVPYIGILNGPSWETLYQGPLTVWGTQFSGALIGEDILQSDNLQINGNTFVLSLGQ